MHPREFPGMAPTNVSPAALHFALPCLALPCCRSAIFIAVATVCRVIDFAPCFSRVSPQPCLSGRSLAPTNLGLSGCSTREAACSPVEFRSSSYDRHLNHYQRLTDLAADPMSSRSRQDKRPRNPTLAWLRGQTLADNLQTTLQTSPCLVSQTPIPVICPAQPHASSPLHLPPPASRLAPHLASVSKPNPTYCSGSGLRLPFRRCSHISNYPAKNI